MLHHRNDECALPEPFGIRRASDFPGTARNGSPRGGLETEDIHPAAGTRSHRDPVQCNREAALTSDDNLGLPQ